MMETNILYAFGALLGGAVLGCAFFLALRINVKLYAEGRVLPAIALHMLRTVISIAGFIGFAALGALPLIVSLGGFLFARHIVLRFEKKNSSDAYSAARAFSR